MEKPLYYSFDVTVHTLDLPEAIKQKITGLISEDVKDVSCLPAFKTLIRMHDNFVRGEETNQLREEGYHHIKEARHVFPNYKLARKAAKRWMEILGKKVPNTAFAILVSEVHLKLFNEPKTNSRVPFCAPMQIRFMEYIFTIPILRGGESNPNGEMSVSIGCVGPEGRRIAKNVGRWWEQTFVDEKCRTHPEVVAQEKLYTHFSYREKKLKSIAKPTVLFTPKMKA